LDKWVHDERDTHVGQKAGGSHTYGRGDPGRGTQRGNNPREATFVGQGKKRRREPERVNDPGATIEQGRTTRAQQRNSGDISRGKIHTESNTQGAKEKRQSILIKGRKGSTTQSVDSDPKVNRNRQKRGTQSTHRKTVPKK